MRIDTGGLPDSDAEWLIKRHEALDWLIASTPATNLIELETKIRRLVAAIHPHSEPMQADFLEDAMMIGLMRDIRSLIEQFHF